MASTDELMRLGELIRSARKAKKLSLEDVAEEAGIKPSYLWIIEKAYVAAGRRPTVPSDTVLENIAKALGIPPPNLHSILGRSRQQNTANLLVREHLAKYNGENKLDPAQVEEISSEVEDFAQVRVDRVMRQLQGVK